MKRIICAILMLAMTLCAVTASAEDGDTRLQLMKCPEQDFVTACHEGLEWSWVDDGTGLNLWLESRDSIPYLLIYRNRDGGGNDAEGYFRDECTPDMQARYGDRLIEVGEFQTYTIQGVEMPGQQYTYLVGDVPVVMLRVFDLRFEGNVQYTAKYLKSDPGPTLEALAIAVNFYRDSADGYDEGTSNPAPSGSGANQSDRAGDYTVAPAAPIVSETTVYNDGRFSMRLPVGWKVMTTGTLAQDLIVKAWDPECPERCIFRAGKIQPLLRSQAAKAWYGQFSELGGLEYTLFADAPALEELTVPCFLSHVIELREYGFKYAYTGLMLDVNTIPALYDVQVVESFPSTTVCLPTCYDNSVARVTFRSENGAACEGLMTAQPTRMEPSMVMNGTDVTPDIVYDFMGFTAPQGEMLELEPVLSACLGSFAFTEDFVRESVRASEDVSEIIRQMSANVQAAYDSYNSAWENRETTYDILSQQRSDATLGYDRLYDAETGEVYRAEQGFWDDYDLHRDAYSNPNLQRVDDSTRDYYLKGVDYTITR